MVLFLPLRPKGLNSVFIGEFYVEFECTFLTQIPTEHFF